MNEVAAKGIHLGFGPGERLGMLSFGQVAFMKSRNPTRRRAFS
jgi:hypothetical protein